MASKPYSPANTDRQAVSINQAWPQIGDQVTLGGVTRADFQAQQANLTAADQSVASAQAMLTEARNQRKAARHELWKLIKRVRNGTKAQYGDDSNEYELVGGVRLSERK